MTICAICLLFELILLATTWPGEHRASHDLHDRIPLLIILAIAAITIIIAAFANRRAIDVATFIIVLVIFTAGSLWLLHRTPEPFVDVFIFQRDACDALLHRHDPYAMTFPDLYGPAGAFVYAPGLARDGRLLFGFPYMPLTLLWDFIGHVAAPDFRYANLAAVFFATGFIATTSRSRIALLAPAIFLFTPRGLYIVEQGWTEPLTLMLLAATVWCAARKSRALPIAFGLLLGSKQYCIFFVLLYPLITDWRDWKFLAKAFTTAAIVTLPFVLWNPAAFWHSAVALQFRQPFRPDSLSFAALLANYGFGRVTTTPAIATACIIAVACVWRLKRSPFAFAFAATCVYLAFFAINKQAFANYYYLVIAAGCSAIAAYPLTFRPPMVR